MTKKFPVYGSEIVKAKYRIEELEQQAKDDYLGDIEWRYILDMLDDVEYAELKALYKTVDDSMHEIMDDRGSDE